MLDTREPTVAALGRLRGLIAEIVPVDVKQLTPDTHFGELGLDSLDRLELLIAIEDQFGVYLGDEQIYTPTVADLLTALTEAAQRP